MARLIPARAGNTMHNALTREKATAHPRSRGEHVDRAVSHRVFPGSSPLARGTRGTAGVLRRRLRLIPARAGNTVSGGTAGSSNKAHPRSRGEHARKHGHRRPPGGSSPLARGTHPHAGTLRTRSRLIPARAGNTVGVPESTCRASAHPRSRGEHPVADSARNISRGSSPLARGTPLTPCRKTQPFRLIPARAGNTLKPGVMITLVTAHPRSRGEHLMGNTAFQNRRGSSPLARGTRYGCFTFSHYTRLIPARAGNTRSANAQSKKSSAHPRSRGEH